MSTAQTQTNGREDAVAATGGADSELHVTTKLVDLAPLRREDIVNAMGGADLGLFKEDEEANTPVKTMPRTDASSRAWKNASQTRVGLRAARVLPGLGQ
jgi:hypothetical protein